MRKPLSARLPLGVCCRARGARLSQEILHPKERSASTGVVQTDGVERPMPNRLTVTALVVEDDVWAREDVAAWLRQQGWIVLETAIGAGALQLIREADRLHLLFADINLADAITGWDVAEAGRVSHPDLAVIYASGRRVRPACCFGVFFCPSLCRRTISCQPVRGLCLSPDKHVFKNRLT
jgi:hypothetical protein